MSVAKATDADFESALSSSPKTIVKYYADWCGSCQLISPYFLQFSEDERFKGIQFLEINSEENAGARKKAQVNYLPFLATFVGSDLKETAIVSWSNDRGQEALQQIRTMLSALI